jgi:hypothetical protein
MSLRRDIMTEIRCRCKNCVNHGNGGLSWGYCKLGEVLITRDKKCLLFEEKRVD